MGSNKQNLTPFETAEWNRARAAVRNQSTELINQYVAYMLWLDKHRHLVQKAELRRVEKMWNETIQRAMKHQVDQLGYDA